MPWYWFRLTGKKSEDINIQYFYEELLSYCDDYALCEELGTKTEGWHTHCLFSSTESKSFVKSIVNQYGYAGNQCFTLKQLEDESEKNLLKIFSYVLKDDKSPVFTTLFERLLPEAKILAETKSSGKRATDLERFEDYLGKAELPSDFSKAVTYLYRAYGRFYRGVGMPGGGGDDVGGGDRIGGGGRRFSRNQVQQLIESILMKDVHHNSHIMDLMVERTLGR